MDRYYETLLSLRERLDVQTPRSSIEELLLILQWADRHQDRVVACDGDRNEVSAPGFSGVGLFTILPPLRAKGAFLSMIDSRSTDVAGGVAPNDISLAFQFEYGGQNIVVGGDGTRANWDWRRMKFERSTGKGIDSLAAALPHHGSSTDCTDDVLSQLFPQSKAAHPRRYGISSGDGRRHPAPEVVRWLSTQNIDPYCTNLIPACGANTTRLPMPSDIEPEFRRWINEVSIDAHYTQVCQGDITLTVEQSGASSIRSQTGNGCPFRRDFDQLFV